MKILLSTFLGLAVATFGACAGTMGAVEPSGEKTITVDQPVNDDLTTASQTVNIESSISGDLAAAGREVTIGGPVGGYAMAAGRNVSVASRIDNDLWAAGETVKVDGQIGDTATLAGRDVRIGRNAIVGTDARLAGSSVQVEGRVERDLSIGAATAVIDGHVGGNVEAHAQRVSILPGAVIDGDLFVRSARPPDISPQAKISGQVRTEQIEQGGFPGWFAMWLMGFLALMILGLPLLVVWPTWAGRIAEVMKARVGVSMLTGLMLLVLTPLAIGLLAVTVVGIPLAAVLLALYLVVLAVSGVFVSYEVGTWLLDRMGRYGARPWQRLALGAAIVSLAVSLPAIGWLFALLVVLLGMGALFLERREARAPVPA